MLGRLIKNNPFILKEVDKKIFKEKNKLIDESIINNYFEYIKPKIGILTNSFLPTKTNGFFETLNITNGSI